MISSFPNSLEFNSTPENSDLKIIEGWLKKENQNYSQGFYCNWDVISAALSENKLVTFNSYDRPIGFIVWQDYDVYAEIVIMAIEPTERNKGCGTSFIQDFKTFIKEKDLAWLKLDCAPKESESFWKKMKFIKFPEGISESDLSYYKPLIDVVEPIHFNASNKLELWNLEPYKINEDKPKWTWKIEDDNFSKPIIQPCNTNWKMRWSKNGITVKEDKVKYFAKNGRILEYGPFLYIKNLNDIL